MKKIIISTSIGQYLDQSLRKIVSVIPLFGLFLSLGRKKNQPSSCVFFLYGGIGDAILAITLINKVSRIRNTVVLCDDRLSALSFLFSKKVSIVKYNKKNFVTQSFRIKKKIAKDSVLVHQTPVIELHIVKLILGISGSMGYISSYDKIYSINSLSGSKKINSINTIVRYEKLYETIRDAFSYQERQCDISQTDLSQSIFDAKYIVVSLSKSPQWKMGKMDTNEYIKIAEFFFLKYGYTVVFVGSSIERTQIDKAIRHSRYYNSLINFAGKTTIKELSVIIKSADFVISNDNGISHLSAYLMKKTLVLFMFSDPEVYKWNYKDYEYIFHPIKSCMPCVGFNNFPVDNYPVICRNNLICNQSLDHMSVINKILKLGWVQPNKEDRND